jgi:hypothetical protein
MSLADMPLQAGKETNFLNFQTAVATFLNVFAPSVKKKIDCSEKRIEFARPPPIVKKSRLNVDAKNPD